VNCRIQFVLLLFLSIALKAGAQGTAFNYQGRLNDAGAPANAAYDFQFTVYNAVTNGSPVSASLTNSAVAVSNGLFNVTLDFGPGIFTGANYWLDLAVRAAGATNFTELAPRQPVLPVPYAIFAAGASNLFGTLSATQLVGTLPSAQVSGTYSGPVNFVNGTNSFSGTFSGNGPTLSNLNASQLIAGTVADARLSTNVALLNHNQVFSGSNLFTGANLFPNASNSFSGAFSGNGPTLSNLNASQLITGTVADARLTANVALLNTNQTFTGTNIFTGANQFTGANDFNGANNFTNRANNFTGSFFGNGLVGWIAVSNQSVQAASDHGYMLTSAGLTTVTLPPASGLTNGDIVRVSGAGAGGWFIAENSGQTIFGNLASYLNSYPVASSNGNYNGVAASADGTRMYAAANSSGNYGITVSSDSGHTWSPVAGILSGSYYSVACSANGKTVYAEPSSGYIQKSTDGGLTWSATATNSTGQFIACTADGGMLITGNVACSGGGAYRAKLSGGVITVFTNAGSSFAITVTNPAAGVSCLAVSSDCIRLVAGTSNGLLYASSNIGATWTAITTTTQVWSGAWMSPDGTKFAATVSGTAPAGGVYSYGVSTLPNTVSTNSTVGGSQGSAVELQYIGNNQFMPVSAVGTLWAN
jgi:hypothetical protein